VILDLALIEPTYQWSLEFYIELFLKGIKTAPLGVIGSSKDNKDKDKDKDKDSRSKNIINQF